MSESKSSECAMCESLQAMGDVNPEQAFMIGVAVAQCAASERAETELCDEHEIVMAGLKAAMLAAVKRRAK